MTPSAANKDILKKVSDMSEENDKQPQPEEAKEAAAEAVSAPESNAQNAADIEALTKRAEDAEARAAELKDGWQRAQADFQNYKKRIERDNELMYASMKGDILKRILPVLDDLERALQNRPG